MSSLGAPTGFSDRRAEWEDVVLNVGAGNGIVAVDDGGTRAGVSGLVLPFG